ncbi:MAG: hypothetical protein H6876_06320 [Hyphomicrobiaceae bacterium]|nr:hypothetical protein [Hyphomicrobiaceae bacterium]
MTTLAAPKVSLKLTPVPKTVLYAGLAGEMLANTGMKDNDQVRAVQQAVSEGLIEEVIVAAKHADGRVEKFTLKMKPFTSTDTVSLQLEAGKSYLETLDVGIAAGVQYAADLIKRRGLTPTFYVKWAARARAAPAVIADAIKRLNLTVETEPPPDPLPTPEPDYTYHEPPRPPTPPPRRYPQTVHTYVAPPALPPQHVYKPVLTITPAKDTGVTFSYETTRRG